MRIRIMIALAVGLVLTACAGAWGDVAIDEANFPDSVFREYVRNSYDTDSDGVLSDAEIADITSINVNNSNITSLKGIEYFTALMYLECYSNQLTELDVTQNSNLQTLHCQDNQLTTLDVTKNTALTELAFTNLTAIDVTKNTALTRLWCRNNQLTELDVTNNTALTYLECRDNQLTELDVTNNTALTHLDCQNNQLTELDVTKNLSLYHLECRENQLTELDVSHNTELTHLFCSENQITMLDVSKNTKLQSLGCFNNLLTELDVSHNTELTHLWCGSDGDSTYKNQLTALDVSKNIKLVYLNFAFNQLTDIDVSKNAALEELWCFNNLLTALNVGSNTKLQKLALQWNRITALDVSSNTLLTYLQCDGNQLTALDVSNNTALEELLCSNNQLTTLDASRNTSLLSLECNSNQLTELNITQNKKLKRLLCYSNQLSSLNLREQQFLEYLDCDDNQLTTLDVSRETLLTELYCGGNQLTTLNVSNNTALTRLYCGRNPLTTLDVSRSTALNWLLCNYSHLTALNVSNNTALEFLDFGSNDVTALNVSNNTALKTLVFGENKLTALDVSNNPVLENLDYSDNQIAALDLSNNVYLERIACFSQSLTLSSLNTTGRTDFPYSINLNTVKSALGLNVEISDFTANVQNLVITDSNGDSVNYSADIAAGIVYFASRPETISYIYNTGYSGTDSPMDVTVTISSETSQSTGRYMFDIPSGVRDWLALHFGEAVYQFTDDEIISETWELDEADRTAITSLNENVILHLPAVKPINSGMYLLRLNLSEAEAGKNIHLYGITSEGGNVSVAALEDTDYILLDENGNEITQVPENGIVYAALRLTANREHRGVITSPIELAMGTIQPIEPDENLLEKIADAVNISADEIMFLTEENISDPQEPTQDMRSELASRQSEIVGKLNTLTVNQSGYYVFKVTLSDDLYEQIKGISINELKAYALHDDGRTESADIRASFINGLASTWELLSLNGEKLEFGVKEFLMVGFLEASTPFSVYLTKLIIALLLGGCDSGLGIAGLAVMGFGAVCLILRKKH